MCDNISIRIIIFIIEIMESLRLSAVMKMTIMRNCVLLVLACADSQASLMTKVVHLAVVMVALGPFLS